MQVRRVHCQDCGSHARERLDFCPQQGVGYTKWLAKYVLALRADMSIRAVAEHTGLHWQTVKDIEKAYLAKQYAKVPLGRLTCVLAPELSREAVFQALQSRRCYGTTGPRILLNFHCGENSMGIVMKVKKGALLTMQAEVQGTAPVEKIELIRGLECIARVQAPEFGKIPESNLLRIMWGGSRIRGRGRRVNWDGILSVKGNRILEARPVSFDSPADGIEQLDDHRISIRSKTTGDKDGVELVLENPSNTGELQFDSKVVDQKVELSDLLPDGAYFELGGIDISLAIHRYPNAMGSYQLNLEHQIDQHPDKKTAYYVKVTQSDGHMAWSSPIFVEVC